MGDALAVLDAVGSERTAVYGSDEGALVGMVMAATHPHRIAALVLFNAWARQVRDDDYPWGVPRHLAEAFAEGNLSGEIDAAALFAPTSPDDQYRQWHNRAGRRGASPATARALFRLRIDSDVRSVLPSIQVPTLVLHRRDNPLFRVGHGRYLAEQIPNATLVELPGDEHIAFLGDSDAVLDEIQEFLTGVRHPEQSSIGLSRRCCSPTSSTAHAWQRRSATVPGGICSTAMTSRCAANCSDSQGWSGRRDSNPRPQPWQGCALPAEPRPRRVATLPTGAATGKNRRSPSVTRVTHRGRDDTRPTANRQFCLWSPLLRGT